MFTPQKFRLLMNVIKYIFFRLMFEDVSNFNITNPEGYMTLQRRNITAILCSQDKLVVFLAFLEWFQMSQLLLFHHMDIFNEVNYSFVIWSLQLWGVIGIYHDFHCVFLWTADILLNHLQWTVALVVYYYVLVISEVFLGYQHFARETHHF